MFKVVERESSEKIDREDKIFRQVSEMRYGLELIEKHSLNSITDEFLIMKMK